MDIDRRVTRRYEVIDEAERTRLPGKGDLLRLRTWDIFERWLPAEGRLLDVGGGPGVHAAHLAGRGFDVALIDPVPHHVDQARATAAAPDGGRFTAEVGEARSLPFPDRSADALLLMGPLYHLVDRADRLAALAEARRVLRPGGRLLAEVITRYAWVLDATRRDLLDEPGTWVDIERTVNEGLTQDPDDTPDGSWWAYFHRDGELAEELAEAGFEVEALVGVEGFAWLLDDLAARLAAPAPLLRVLRLVESEPSLLGASAHLIGVATAP